MYNNQTLFKFLLNPTDAEGLINSEDPPKKNRLKSCSSPCFGRQHGIISSWVPVSVGIAMWP